MRMRFWLTLASLVVVLGVTSVRGFAGSHEQDSRVPSLAEIQSGEVLYAPNKDKSPALIATYRCQPTLSNCTQVTELQEILHSDGATTPVMMSWGLSWGLVNVEDFREAIRSARSAMWSADQWHPTGHYTSITDGSCITSRSATMGKTDPETGLIEMLAPKLEQLSCTVQSLSGLIEQTFKVH